MILFKWNYNPETRGPNYPCLAFRWTFQISKWAIGFIHQHNYEEIWYNSHTDVYEVYFGKWKFGSDHCYYDGPHCMYYLGFLHLQLGGNWKCKKCLP